MRTLVSFAYYEKGTRRHQQNLLFFLQEGVQRFQTHKNVDVVLCLNGPCAVPLPANRPHFFVLQRSNEGFDFGAHAAVLKHQAHIPYDYYVFLNGSQRGPFLPTYWPKNAHWTEVFTGQLAEPDFGLIGASHFWHPKRKKPVVETWAFALTAQALALVQNSQSVFFQHPSKTSAQEAEDRLTDIVLDGGLKFASLLLKFRKDTSDRNNYKICSRPWNYEEISINPLETVFYKTFWDTAEPKENFYECPFETRYTQWIMNEGRSRPLHTKVKWTPQAREPPLFQPLLPPPQQQPQLPPQLSPAAIAGIVSGSLVAAVLLGLVIFKLGTRSKHVNDGADPA